MAGLSDGCRQARSSAADIPFSPAPIASLRKSRYGDGNQQPAYRASGRLKPTPRTGDLEMLINFIVWLIVGGIIGWIASLIMRTDAQQGTLVNIVVGIVGAFVAGLLLTPLFDIGTINSGDFSFQAMALSLLGAILLLAVVNLFRRG